MRNRIASYSVFLAGVAAGAGLMALFDPRGGARRRSLIRDKVVRGAHLAGRNLDKHSRNAANHLKGYVYEAWANLRDRNIDDGILVERVRAQIGRHLSHPGLLNVDAQDGCVVLSGYAGRDEIPQICRRLENTRGVRDYDIRVRTFGGRADAARISGALGNRNRRSEEEMDVNAIPGTEQIAS
jgi:hypothetical protein